MTDEIFYYIYRILKSSICRQTDMVGDPLLEQDNCSKYFSTGMANAVRGVALAVWGTQPRDRMLIAEMSVNSSITELVQAENTTKNELAQLVERVRALPVNKNKAALKDLLLKSRCLRNTLTTMGKKRMGMEKQLETLRQSQMNQNMLISMKHTSEALQTLGMKVSDADNIMLDLEDSASDMSSMQNTLSTSHFDNDMNDIDLNDELALLLSDTGFEPVFSAHAVKESPAQAHAVKESPAQISAPESATTIWRFVSSQCQQ
jgi:hypothetical protein